MMSHSLEGDVTGYQPIVPESVRRFVWYLTLIVGALTLLFTGLSQIWFESYASDILATGGVLSSVMAFLSGSLGVAYVGKS